MIGRDGVAGLVCLGGSLWFLALTQGLPQPALVPIGPGFYPRIVLGATAALSVLLVVSDALRRREKAPARARTGVKRNHGLVALTFTLFALYVLVLPGLGYRLATFLFVGSMQAALAPPRGRRWLLVIAAAAATAIATHLVFERQLSVLLPRGRWTGF